MKILVAYASKFGTTTQVAECIAQTLQQYNHQVDVIQVAQVDNIADYDAVIIGAAIHYDHWMTDAQAFVKTHQATLSTKPVACFFTCLALSKQTEKDQQQADTYRKKIANLNPHINPISIGCFAGAVKYQSMPFLFRLVARVILSVMKVKEGDYRDWAVIRTWALDVETLIAEAGEKA